MSTHESLLASSKEALRAAHLIPEPYLHVEAASLYNPITDRSLSLGEAGYDDLRGLAERRARVRDVPPATVTLLDKGGWLVEPAEDLDRRFRLKFVSLEANTVCNQACYFCPVSVDPQAADSMPMKTYVRIVGEIAEFRETVLAVFMNHYNEPTADPEFVSRVHVLKEHRLPPALLTNGSGLTPARVDALVAVGGLAYLSVNLSTLDRARYVQDRGHDHLELVMRNLEYARDREVAPRMEIVVLGRGDEVHRRDFAEITRAFDGGRFVVKSYEVMDRAGYLKDGRKPDRPHARLAGCEQTGSRPLQHLHVTAQGRCLLCCEDYSQKYVVGDLTRQSVREVLAGAEMARLRRFTYGLEEAPADYMCRACLYARSG